MPKFNMYQSLHTTVIGPQGKPVELQIRTFAMHRRAEYGIAAHWKYKEDVRLGRDTDRASLDGSGDMAWVRQLLDWQQETEDPGEFLESLRFEINSAEVYVFTPRGDVIALPTGSTPVDFAYAIHTEVGHRTIGARVNGRLVPLESTLDNGDVVEVFTSKAPNGGAEPGLARLRQVTAGPQQDPAVVHQGAPRGGHRAGQGADRPADAQGGRAAQAGAHPRDAVRRRRRAAAGRRLRAVRRGRRGQRRCPDRRTPGHRPVRRRRRAPTRTSPRASRSPAARPRRSGRRRRRRRDRQAASPTSGSSWRSAARRCRGDDILGFVTRGAGVSVHRARLHQRRAACTAQPERLVEVEWAPTAQSMFLVNIQVEALDRARLLSDITKVLSDVHVNILAAVADTGRDRVAKSRFTFEMADPKHLGHVLRAVRARRRRLRRLPRHPVATRRAATSVPVDRADASRPRRQRSRELVADRPVGRAACRSAGRSLSRRTPRGPCGPRRARTARASMAAACSAAFCSLPAATALSCLASRSAIDASSWATVSAARARASGFDRRHCVVLDAADRLLDLAHPALELLDPLAGDLAGGVPAVGDVAERRLGGLRSVTGSSASASTSSASFFVGVLGELARRCSAFAASRAPKKVSWAPRNRFHSWSSTPLGAGPASFHCRIRSRYAPAVGPHSVEPASASASLTSRSLTTWRTRAARSSPRSAPCGAGCTSCGRSRTGATARRRRTSPAGGAPSTRRAAARSRLAPLRQSLPCGEPLGLGGDVLLGGRASSCFAARSASRRPRAAASIRVGQRVEPGVEPGEVADGLRVGTVRAHLLERARGVVGAQRPGLHALLEQVDLEGEGGVGFGEEGEHLLGVAAGQLADLALAVGGAHEDGAVVGDPAAPRARPARRGWPEPATEADARRDAGRRGRCRGAGPAGRPAGAWAGGPGRPGGAGRSADRDRAPAAASGPSSACSGLHAPGWSPGSSADVVRREAGPGRQRSQRPRPRRAAAVSGSVQRPRPPAPR